MICQNTDKNNNAIDHNKVLNSKCYCKIGLPWVRGSVVMAYPCEHMFHEKCFDRMDGVCKLCGSAVEKKITILDEDLHYQRFADLLSMSHYDDMGHNNTPSGFMDSMFDLATALVNAVSAQSKKDGRQICEKVFSLNNLTLKVYGLEKIKLEKNKVFICNHVSTLEIVILYYLLGCGFLISSVAEESTIMDHAKRIIPILIINRGDKNRKINVVDEIRRFVDERGSICIFPEGLMKHPDTLSRFRTGAFHVERPVYSITIRHNDIVTDGRIDGFLYKLSGKQSVNIEVHIMGPYYPPFDDHQIEGIRSDMARHGNLLLSRVSNRDIVD
jgi:1-acyl-sn-glycerol-3-phosphate acyltransferase